jgi:hypothetical protein
MNPTLKNTLMAMATAALGLGSAAGCSDKSSETPEAESSAGGEAPAGEATSGEASCSGEGSCSAEAHGGEPPAPTPAPEGEAPPSP